MRIRAGLRREDWTHWGQFTTFKTNAAQLLARDLRPDQTIYCSPLTDPYQPAESQQNLMPDILRAVADHPPRIFVIQTRGPLILRDMELLLAASRVTCLRVSFSVTTDREDVRRIFEPHCASIEDRWKTIAALRAAGIETVATLAPILPCDPEALITRALDATSGPVVADPFHVRAAKPSGAQTREPAYAICRKYGWDAWLDPEFQTSILQKMQSIAARKGRHFGWGPSGFSVLARNPGTEVCQPESYN
jgi:DNA repair photolyase